MSILSLQSLKQLGCQLWWPGQSASANSVKTITANGDVKQILPFAGAGMGMFDGTGDYLTVPASDAWVQTTSMQIGGLICLTAYPASGALINIYSVRVTGTDASSFHIRNTAGVYTLVFERVSGGTTVISLSATITPALNTWYSFFVTHDGSTIKLYFNNVQVATVATAAVLCSINSVVLSIGKWSGGDSGYLTGYLSEFFIKSGGPVITTFPFRQIDTDSNTKLLLHFLGSGNTFVDSSPSPKTVTAYGDAKQLSSPCGSGVAAFDGTGDYLSTPANITDFQFGTGNFTLEGWIYPISASNYVIFSTYNTYNGNYAYTISLIPAGGIQMETWSGTTSLGIISTSTNLLNGWHHWAFTRNGNTFTGYIDGQSIGTFTSALAVNNPDANTPIIIGAWRGSVAWNYYAGYQSGIRVTKGIARYTAPFTPSTQPFKPDPYTKLLLHMDVVGAAFYDSSDPPGDNGFPILPDGVTVTPNGTFTSQRLKNGLACYKFDGSTNYISLSDHDAWSIYDSDFTIGMWVKFDSIVTSKYLLGQYANDNSRIGIIWYYGNSILIFGYSGGVEMFNYSCPLTPVANTWYHIVIIRSGTTCLMYIDAIGKVVTTTTAFAGVVNVAAPLTIGNYSGSFQTGNIKDLMIFKRALTLDQIGALMDVTFIY